MARSRMQRPPMPASCSRTLYTALAHTLQHSNQLTEEALLTRLAQFRAHHRQNRRGGAIERTKVDHRIRRKRLRLSSNDPIETAPDECTGLNLASSAGAVPIGT